MKMKALVAFGSKLLTPCNKLLLLLLPFRFKLKKPLFIRPLRLRFRTNKARKTPPKNRTLAGLFAFFCPFRQRRKMDRLMELRSVSETEREKLFPSPLTPAYIKASRSFERETNSRNEEVEDACRSFENYLVEMIVEEGKMRDLTDVEELLYCWKNLKCPVFIDLVSRFYGELCKDLFSPEDDGIDRPESSSAASLFAPLR